IPAADRERVWDRFWRLERDRGSAVAGTGIGLAVVRELVALHGGRAWAEDGQNGTLPAGGRGVRFVIELPLERPAERAPGGSPRVPAGPASSSSRTTPNSPKDGATHTAQKERGAQ